MTANTSTSADRLSRTVRATDGVELAVYETGATDGPTALLIHGYPDDHTVWHGVARLLAGRFRVVSYDVRGAGRSGRPPSTRSYRIGQLAEDLAAVLDAVAPDGKAHVMAHDWGSIQAWDALGEARIAARIGSFTSISGPSLDMVSVWLRQMRDHPRAVAAQVRDSFYMPIFQLPVVPELLVRAGLVARGVAASSSRGSTAGTEPHIVSRADALDGIELYRANLARRMLAPRPMRISVPVQVLAPVDDMHVTVACQVQAPAPFVRQLRTREIDGNHWVVAQRPDLVAACFGSFVDAVESTVAHP